MITTNQFGHSMVMTIGLVLTISLFSFSACVKEDPTPQVTAQDVLDQSLELVDKDQLATDLATIDDSLAVWGLTNDVIIGPEGVRYTIETLGTGAKPTLEDPIRFKYKGSLLSNGQQFDASDSIDIFLFQLIIGFQTVLPEIPVGSSITMYIPSGYGYGPNDYRDNNGNVLIPGNSNLIFEVELLEIL